MTILAIDPGPEHSGYVVWTGSRVVEAMAEAPNHGIVQAMLEDWTQARLIDTLVLEKIENLGMPAVGASVFETAYWSGIFAQAFGLERTCRIGRREVKLHLCGSMQAKNSNIRQALLDRFGGEAVALSSGVCRTCKGKGWKGRGRPPCPDCQGSGVSGPPGVLFDITSHAWSALALAVTFHDKQSAQPENDSADLHNSSG